VRIRRLAADFNTRVSRLCRDLLHVKHNDREPARGSDRGPRRRHPTIEPGRGCHLVRVGPPNASKPLDAKRPAGGGPETFPIPAIQADIWTRFT
jgi:hypothetical protein